MWDVAPASRLKYIHISRDPHSAANNAVSRERASGKNRVFRSPSGLGKDMYKHEASRRCRSVSDTGETPVPRLCPVLRAHCEGLGLPFAEQQRIGEIELERSDRYEFVAQGGDVRVVVGFAEGEDAVVPEIFAAARVFAAFVGVDPWARALANGADA